MGIQGHGALAQPLEGAPACLLAAAWHWTQKTVEHTPQLPVSAQAVQAGDAYQEQRDKDSNGGLKSC